MLSICLSSERTELEQIIALQRANQSSAVARDQWDSQGFVTMEYTVAQLQEMSGAYRHVLAKSDGVVVGYALVMLKQYRDAFPFLHAMFDTIEAGFHDGRALCASRYFVMGQVCIAQSHRGSGIFGQLYAKLKEQMAADFDLVLTEVSEKNGRSLRAHRQLGFRDIATTAAPTEWHVIAWNWQRAAARV